MHQELRVTEVTPTFSGAHPAREPQFTLTVTGTTGGGTSNYGEDYGIAW